MNDHRSKPNMLNCIEAGSFGSHFEYPTTLPLKDILHDQFFLPNAANFRAGDQIALVRLDKINHASGKMLEYAEVRVIETSRQGIPLFVVMGPIDVAAPTSAVVDLGRSVGGSGPGMAPASAPIAVGDSGSPSQGEGGLNVKRGFAGKWYVMNGAARVSEHTSKAEAEAAMDKLISTPFAA